LSEAEGAETRIAQPRHQNSVSLDLSIEIAPLLRRFPTTPEDVTENIVRIQEVGHIDLSLEDTDQTVNELNPNICKQA